MIENVAEAQSVVGSRASKSSETLHSETLHDVDLTKGLTYPDTLDAVARGEIFVFRQALQHAGLMEDVTEQTLRAIKIAAGGDAADRVRADGFQYMHRHLSADQFLAANEIARHELQRILVQFTIWFAKTILTYSRRIYIDSNAVVRYFAPYGYSAENQDVLARAPGFTKIQGPHQDNWFDHALGGLNIWVAAGPVRRGNGLCIFPNAWGYTLAHDGRYGMPRNQELGTPVNFDLSPGDIIFFHGEHLHSSELNRTDETRYALTTRFTRERPKFSETNQWHPWYRSTTFGTPFERLFELMDLPFKQMLAHKLKNKFSRSGAVERERRVRIDRDNVSLPESHDPRIHAVDAHHIAVDIDGDRHVLSRRCPHEGADLSLGYVCDGKLHCPWHHAPFDPTTGKAMCPGLSDLEKPKDVIADSVDAESPAISRVSENANLRSA